MGAFEILRPGRPHGPFLTPQGPWAPLLLDLRTKGEDAGVQARALESAGASPLELTHHLMDLFHGAFPRFLGLSRGFAERGRLDPRDTELGLWILATLKDPWRVLEMLGTDPVNLLRYLLSTWAPSLWVGDLHLLRLPDPMRRALGAHGVTIVAEEGMEDLRWLPQRIQGDLHLQGPHAEPREFGPIRAWGAASISEAQGLVALHRVSARSLVVEDCADLTAITLDAHTPTVIRGCRSLLRVHGNVAADLTIDDCPSLRTLDILLPRDAVPAPSLAVTGCPTLKWVGRLATQPRVVKNLTLMNNPALVGVRQPLLIRGHRHFEGCPLLADPS